ncbi:hypothetical protein [Streptomyces noursei]|uniref:hypothetical protein n=1 Tax=Streptomyces noursei TaxID=1971 RepID=UPI00069F5F5F|nr:hypothetical protein [Streptomyces noursei]
MTRTRRDRTAERAALQAAAERLLAGTPLHSTSGKLTTTELIAESGLRRDVVYEHRDLVDFFKAHAKAQRQVPHATQALVDRVACLKAELLDAKAHLQRERETSVYLRRIIAELSIELDSCQRRTGLTLPFSRCSQ